MTRAIAITLKIPDNTAYTAAVALRRLGIGVDRVERSEIWFFDDGGDVHALVASITADETIFNPNKHRVTVLDEPVPRSGEVWIGPLDPVTLSLSKGDREKAATAWRLFEAHGEPLDKSTLHAAAERLLCNPAIERAVY
jgi:hypothetical protein